MSCRKYALGRVFVLLALALWTVPAPAAASSRPEFFVEVRKVTQSDSVTCDLKQRTRDLLTAALSAQPSVVTQLDSRKLVDPELEAKIAPRGQTGYAVYVHITRCSHRLLPPRPGHAYRLLEAEVHLAIDAEELPAGTMARAGEGSARVTTEVGLVKASEIATLRLEALEQAIRRVAREFGRTLGQKRTRRHTRRRTRTARR